MQWAEAFLFAEIHLFFSLAAIFGSDFRTVAMCSHCSDLSWQNYGSFHWMNKILCCWRTYDVKLHEYNMECILFRENSLFDTGKMNRSFLGPEIFFVPYLTLISTFIPNLTLPSNPLANGVNWRLKRRFCP